MSGDSLAARDAVDPLIHAGYLDDLAAAYLGGPTRGSAGLAPLRRPHRAAALDDLGRVGRDAARRLAAAGAAAAVAHVDVALHVYPRMIHAFPLWDARLADGRAALAEAGAFVEKWLG